jgi:type VI secretion system protein ImpH
MAVNFMGLIGPLGVLPLYYTELIQQRLMARDASAQVFLDIFHHRMLSLFYRAWQKHRFHIYYGRREFDRFSTHLLDLIGLGHKQLQDRQAVADDSLVSYAGLITQQPRSAVSLEGYLEDYFGVPVRVEQFIGAWYRLDVPSQTRFNDEERLSESLGAGAVVGDEVWEPQARLRVVLGPLSLVRYLEFLPSGRAYRPLRALTRFFAGDEFDFELQLVLKRNDVPACELGVAGEAAPQLGWVSWAKSNAMNRDPAETILPL